ncbi:MAG: LLM class flavin-dependent oxidoreductase [Mycobacterium sp.]
MRAAITLEASSLGSWSSQKTFVREAERMGLDVCWVAEAWGSDAVAALGYYAACSDRMLIGSGIIQLATRTPVAIAQAAITLSNVSAGRFLLGLGASGPQVIEGLHGQAFANPGGRMRETIEIIRQVIAGERVAFSGKHFHIPRPGSETKSMRVSMRAEHKIPLYVASLTPSMLRLTGEVADGWLGTSFVPEGADQAYFTHLDEGLSRSGRSRSALDICQGAEVSFALSDEQLQMLIDARRPELAFSLGGMGSASTNFYNQAYSRQGWADVAAEVRQRWQSGDRAGAAEIITDEMILATTLIGTETMVRDRLQVWSDTGVDTVRIYPAGSTLEQRLETLGRAIEIVHATNRR